MEHFGTVSRNLTEQHLIIRSLILVVGECGSWTGRCTSHRPWRHYILIYSDSRSYIYHSRYGRCLFFLQFFSLFLTTSLITSTVFISHGFADCLLSIVCVYLQPSIYISDSSPLLLPYCLFIHSFQPISGYLVNMFVFVLFSFLATSLPFV